MSVHRVLLRVEECQRKRIAIEMLRVKQCDSHIYNMFAILFQYILCGISYVDTIATCIV